MKAVNTDKEIFEFVRNADIPKLPALKDLLSSYHIPVLEITNVLQKIRTDRSKHLIIDARSESEYKISSLPMSKSFPVLNDKERHNVGLIYKKYSQASALWLAMKYADPKSEKLEEFLRKEDAHSKEITVYCWRGGGRSGYLARMISDLGYNPSVIKGGHKAFRNLVSVFFQNEFPSRLIELSGLTGCGKTELLRSVSGYSPVIDLELAALHFSSLLGRIPYLLKGIDEVKNQSAFENRLYSQIILNSTVSNLSDEVFFIESESKKVGEFFIPIQLYNSMETSQSVKINSTIEMRIDRLKKDYFGNAGEGILPMRSLLQKKRDFFRQQLSTNVFDELIELLDSGNTDKFIEIMLVKYYDVKYKDKGKKHIAEVSSDDPETAIAQLREIYSSVAAKFRKRSKLYSNTGSAKSE